MLLGIQDAKFLTLHPLRRGLFENFIIAELLKRYFNRDLRPRFYFWRDSNGVEVDCLIEREGKILPVEIKSTQTLTSFPTHHLKSITSLMGGQALGSYIIYGGEQSFELQGTKVLSWKNLEFLL